MISGTPWLIVDIDANWHRIGPLVKGVDPRDNEGDDLRQDCRKGKALCLISADGVMVISLQPDRYGSGELELFVRMACAWGEGGSIQRNDAHLDAIARDLGAAKIVCHSSRPGMRRALSPEWVVRYTVFERTVHGLEKRRPAARDPAGSGADPIRGKPDAGLPADLAAAANQAR